MRPISGIITDISSLLYPCQLHSSTYPLQRADREAGGSGEFEIFVALIVMVPLVLYCIASNYANY